MRSELPGVVFPSFFSQGILGSLKSGKSALVNKYITGSYSALEKPDGENVLIVFEKCFWFINNSKYKILLGFFLAESYL